ncbi:MAG: DNA polymerase III subunit alpha [Candidatus Portnoybacteria bacterium CG10_big_fil_rev_8_21_14_0_10_36_7]|uniref:DNA polymerase III subunit alpha n=1 Tax=Candidatus Portnoybacteria bacterium CG10_big_fil_rev_8_21_14_0_10_36_7 TaxID=1974812 RepID=A0A2M8KEU1_9BACT|nr:MAG: DNA polymerase III subunit alpha [Candidatus Portnoybacteria bacterium CG10_big_fil_rev_8_21_14_0_10_36_7]
MAEKKNTKFTHLHVHSHYSLLDGLAKIDDLVELAKEREMDSLALTDHGTMYGAIEFYTKAKAAGVKPILGVESYIAPNGIANKRPRIDDKRFHLILLAKNQTGYQNLVQLVTASWLDGFYYKPRIDKELLAKHSKGLIGSSACLGGELARTALNTGDINEIGRVAKEYEDIFGKDNFFVELEHHPGIPEQAKVNSLLIKTAKKFRLPLVATHDVHYLKPEDANAQDILMLVQTGANINNEERLTMKHDDFSLRPASDMMEYFKDTPEAIENTQRIASECNLNLTLDNIQLPHFEVPNGTTPNKYLKDLCYQNLPKKYGKAIKAVIDRIEYELSIIKKTGYASYFLIVYDFVKWSKENKIVVGPGRGSAAGSIVSYLLNITEIDPLKYDLLFERFLNPERISLPDIDMDFADTRRDEVINYVREKYGKDHVAQIITFGTMAARAAIRDTGRAMGLSYNFCDQTAKMIPAVPGMTLKLALEQSLEFREAYTKDEDTKNLVDTASKLEGVVRHASTHACGVVITKDPLSKITPLQHPNQNDNIIISQYEMHAIESLGLLKIDFLGLRNLTIIENTLKIIKRTKGVIIVLEDLPLDDKATFRLFQDARTTGIFQLESGGMKRYLKELEPNVFEDIIAMIALYRPGPMELIPEFVARKHGKRKIEYLHPKLEPILKNTYGISVYQEQLMAIARDLAGFTLSQADTLRKAIGKKIKTLLDEQKIKIIEGMVANKISEQTARRIWETIEPFAQYGFNKSHAACYAMIGYQTAYLKAHYPTEFMAALMVSEQDDIERLAFLIDEAKQMQIEVLAPDINESLANFTVVGENKIRFGLNAIKNVGHNIIKAIVEARQESGPFPTIDDFIERVRHKDLNKKSLESLIKCGAMETLGERNQLLGNLEDILSYAREMKNNHQNGQFSLFGGEEHKKTSFLRLKKQEPAEKREKLSWEKQLLGLYISEHPIYEYLERLRKDTKSIKDATDNNIKNVSIGGIITNVHKVITKTGKPMLFVEIEDDSGKIEALIFPTMLEHIPTLWQEEKIVILSGKLSDKDGVPKLLADNAREFII